MTESPDPETRSLPPELNLDRSGFVTARPSLLGLCRAVTLPMVRRSMLIALVVGGLLFGINSGDALARDGLSGGLALKAVVTMLVPFVVSLASAAATRVELRRALGAAAPCGSDHADAP